jgi:hypothetical protein
MTHQKHSEDWEVVTKLFTPNKTALLEILGNEANFDPFQTCNEYSRYYQCIVKFAVTVVLVEDVELIFLH